MSVCVQLYNTGWDVFSIEILGGGVCLLCENQGVLFPSLQLCTRDGNLTRLLDFLRSSSRNMLQWLMWSTPMATPRCV